MENKIFEAGPEKIPTKEEVMKIVSVFAENTVFVRELADDKGLYLLEVKVESEKDGETVQYEYMRKGRHPNNNESSETSIYMMTYKDGMPQNGTKVAICSESGVWEQVK